MKIFLFMKFHDLLIFFSLLKFIYDRKNFENIHKKWFRNIDCFVLHNSRIG